MILDSKQWIVDQQLKMIFSELLSERTRQIVSLAGTSSLEPNVADANEWVNCTILLINVKSDYGRFHNTNENFMA